MNLLLLSVSIIVVSLLGWRLSRLRRQNAELQASAARLAKELAESDARLLRFERQQDQTLAAQRKALLLEMLSIDELLQRCLRSPQSPVHEELQLLRRELDRNWHRLGLRRISPRLGSDFDPSEHEAIAVTKVAGLKAQRIAFVERDGFAWQSTTNARSAGLDNDGQLLANEAEAAAAHATAREPEHLLLPARVCVELAESEPAPPSPLDEALSQAHSLDPSSGSEDKVAEEGI